MQCHLMCPVRITSVTKATWTHREQSFHFIFVLADQSAHMKNTLQIPVCAMVTPSCMQMIRWPLPGQSQRCQRGGRLYSINKTLIWSKIFFLICAKSSKLHHVFMFYSIKNKPNGVKGHVKWLICKVSDTCLVM